MVLSPKVNDLCRSVSLGLHCDKRKEKDRLFVGAGRCRGLYDPGLSRSISNAKSSGVIATLSQF
jgi:hypothetical protein